MNTAHETSGPMQAEHTMELLSMNPTIADVRLSEIEFDEGLYPRVEGHDPELVQTYARDMEQIEAAKKYIAVNAHNVLLDGRHRHLAYQKLADRADKDVTVYRYPVESPLESFRLACALQDRGKRLSDADRVDAAKKLYSLGTHNNKAIAAALGVAESTISQWLSRTRKDEKERQRKKARALWLACYTQEEIAEAVGVTQPTAKDWIDGFIETSVAEEFMKWHGFDPPLYNTWKRQERTPGVDHFGYSEQRWVENLLYFYTQPSNSLNASGVRLRRPS